MIISMVPIEAPSELALLGLRAALRRRALLLSRSTRFAYRSLVVCLAAMAALLTPSFAQKVRNPVTTGSGVTSITNVQPVAVAPIQSEEPDPFQTVNFSAPGVITVTPETARSVESEACNSWTDSGVHSPTVSVVRLEVPGKASNEFQKACSSYKSKKYTDAEGHVRKAIDIYPDYAASWVLLGQ